MSGKATGTASGCACGRFSPAAASTSSINDPASAAGLYLWLSGPEDMSALDLVGAFAELGIVVAPGDFYGEVGAGRVRMSLTVMVLVSFR